MKKKINLLKSNIALILNFFYDYNRYRKYSSSVHKKSKNSMLAEITLLYHIIEKGLTYQTVKIGFGKEKILKLISVLRKGHNNNYFEGNEIQIVSAVSALQNYYEFHLQNNYILDSDVIEGIRNVKKLYSGSFFQSSTFDYSPRASYSNLNFKELNIERHSIRNFSSKQIDYYLVKESIDMALKAPSVCNRQSSRIVSVENHECKEKVLRLQGGTRGFNDNIPILLIIVFDTKYFFGSAERNQGYVDSGIFTMNLMHSLLFNGIGSCPLHWSMNFLKDQELRKVVNLIETEEVVMMLGIGYMENTIKVAQSTRYTNQHVLKRIS